MSTKRTCFLQDNTCTVDNDFVCLNDLSSEKINRSWFLNASTEVEAIRYRSDATDADIVKIDLKRTSLCRGHYDCLYVKFDPKKSKQCYTCIPFFQKEQGEQEEYILH